MAWVAGVGRALLVRVKAPDPTAAVPVPARGNAARSKRLAFSTRDAKKNAEDRYSGTE